MVSLICLKCVILIEHFCLSLTGACSRSGFIFSGIAASCTCLCCIIFSLYLFIIFLNSIIGYNYSLVDSANIRSPSVSRIRAKMLYATSKDRFRRELDGVHYELQATDPTELDLENLRERAH